MMSVFRVLLNILVIAVLELSGFVSESISFCIAVAMLMGCLASVALLEQAARSKKGSRSDDEAADDIEIAALDENEATNPGLSQQSYLVKDHVTDDEQKQAEGELLLHRAPPAHRRSA